MSPARPAPGSEPSAKGASILLDLLGVETFANEAVAYIAGELGTLSASEQAFIRAGALKGAMLVADEVRKFGQRA